MDRPATFRFLVVAALVGIFATGLAFLVLRSSGPGDSIEIILPQDQAAREIAVHVTGAVGLEGVYTLREGDRVIDAVEAAGGLSPSADGAAVNLAQRLRDGEQIRVPRLGEPPAPPAGVAGLLDLNAASTAELEELPGIGPARALAIVAYRDGNGGFGRVEDLLRVDGIGPGTLAGIRDLVLVR